MATAWLTYAWADNKDSDVDFIAQELMNAGLQVKLDRWNLTAGQRLWEQIARFISDPKEGDAWMIYATQNSLGSEKCKEEIGYALGRALETRGGAFPFVGVFPGRIDRELIPPAISTRLYVSTTDVDWKERIVAAAEGRSANITKPTLAAFSLTTHTMPYGEAIEIRPRAGTWSPFYVGVPLSEKERVVPFIMYGPRGRVPEISNFLTGIGENESMDHQHWLMHAPNEATPTQSYFLISRERPSEIIFGELGGVGYRVGLVQMPQK